MTAIKERVALAQARFIAARSPEQLARLERGPVRRVVLRSFPLALRLLFSRKAAFDAAGQPLAGVVELKIRDPNGDGADAFEVVIRDGRCEAHRGAATRPGASLSIGLADMLRLGSGAVDPGFFLAEGMAAGRIELQGDVFLFLSFPNVFRMANRKLI
jgi:hypothetical protein